MRHSIGRIHRFCMLALMAGALALGSPTMAAILVVDKDLADCPNADFVSIQAAVAAAAPGDTIKVCPDLYTETVTVNKPLALDGAGPDPRARTGDPTKEAVVQFTTIFGIFNLQSDGIVLRGFTIQGNASGPGIYTSPLFSDYQIEKNLIRDNVFGLYLNNNGVNVSIVEKNAFNNNTRPGAANGNGIYSDQGLNNALIQKNYFTGHFNAVMVFAGVQSNLVIAQNELVDDSSIVLFNTTQSLISQNRSLRHSGSGIFLGGNVTDTTVSQNDLRNGTGTGIRVTNAFPGPNADLLIEKNHIRGSAFDGIRLGQTTNSTIRQNQSMNNASDGIQMDASTANNQIVQNHMKQNGEHDAHDDSVGPGTGGTANFWIKNQCKTDNRGGALCKH
ncbi:MAG: right-handed parallel beta-helix repeat-containing protein [Armatimonadetes bacterium]|nr:right-handed parallel beta-helix repeat-containing protein [Armatimonadota bacterium]